jgi:uncharacterized FlaG/YvyC family protein
MDIRPISSVGSGAIMGTTTTSTPSNSDVQVRQVIAAIHDMNKSELMGEGRQVSFARDPDTHKPVIQIIDESTGEVLDQLPPESFLKLAEQLK